MVNNTSDTSGPFVKIQPVPVEREIIVDFKLMLTDMVKIDLNPFEIGKFPVTNVQFASFIDATDYKPKKTTEFIAHWNKGYSPKGQENHPVVFVSYDDAIQYGRWAGGRLPTYEEWIYAALGNTLFKYPWGDDTRPDLCNVRESNIGMTSRVGKFSPEGDSPWGCADMFGNVWEWTSTQANENDIFLALGTGWDHYSWQTEIPLDHWYRNRSTGFRIVRDINERV